jgi:hypothetical protein
MGDASRRFHAVVSGMPTTAASQKNHALQKQEDREKNGGR